MPIRRIKRMAPIDVTTKPRDESEGIRSRCPACDNFVTEGTQHDCPNGRHRENFQNPIMERK